MLILSTIPSQEYINNLTHKNLAQWTIFNMLFLYLHNQFIIDKLKFIKIKD
jgi:hypothetical protein